MTPEEFHEKLPEYLAGELSESEERRVRAFLEANPSEQSRVEALLAALDAVRQTVPPPDEAEQRVSELPIPAALIGRGATRQAAARAAAGRLRLVSVALRYAAVILLAFASGYWARGRQGGELAGTPPQGETTQIVVRLTEAGPLAGPLSPRLAERLERAVRDYPQGQTLTWALLSLAAR
jgi:anti-sigma factor RsiW